MFGKYVSSGGKQEPSGSPALAQLFLKKKGKDGALPEEARTARASKRMSSLA